MRGGGERAGRGQAVCRDPACQGPARGVAGAAWRQSGSLSATPSPAGAAGGHGLSGYQEMDFCSWAGTAWLRALASRCSLCPWFPVFKVRVQSLCPIELWMGGEGGTPPWECGWGRGGGWGLGSTTHGVSISTVQAVGPQDAGLQTHVPSWHPGLQKVRAGDRGPSQGPDCGWNWPGPRALGARPPSCSLSHKSQPTPDLKPFCHQGGRHGFPAEANAPPSCPVYLSRCSRAAW